MVFVLNVVIEGRKRMLSCDYSGKRRCCEVSWDKTLQLNKEADCCRLSTSQPDEENHKRNSVVVAPLSLTFLWPHRRVVHIHKYDSRAAESRHIQTSHTLRITGAEWSANSQSTFLPRTCVAVNLVSLSPSTPASLFFLRQLWSWWHHLHATVMCFILMWLVRRQPVQLLPEWLQSSSRAVRYDQHLHLGRICSSGVGGVCLTDEKSAVGCKVFIFHKPFPLKPMLKQ